MVTRHRLRSSLGANRSLAGSGCVVALSAALTITAPDAAAQTAGPDPMGVTPTSANGGATTTSPYHELDNTGALFLGIESGLSLGAFLGVTYGFKNPPDCKWCTPPGFDVSIRNALVWDNRKLAANIADGMAVAAGVGALAAVIVPPLTDARAKKIWALEDTLILANAVLVNLAITDVFKAALARQRPALYFNEAERTSSGNDGNKSFPSGHTSFAFAAASSATTLSFLRGYDSAPYVAAGGGTLAVATGLCRIFADKHWATDVIGGAVLGSAIGFSMPFFLHGRSDSETSAPTDGTTTTPQSGAANVRDVALSVRPLGIGGPSVVTLDGTW